MNWSQKLTREWRAWISSFKRPTKQKSRLISLAFLWRCIGRILKSRFLQQFRGLSDTTGPVYMRKSSLVDMACLCWLYCCCTVGVEWKLYFMVANRGKIFNIPLFSLRHFKYCYCNIISLILKARQGPSVYMRRRLISARPGVFCLYKKFFSANWDLT